MRGEARDDDVIFVALDGGGRLQGFAEATLRGDYVNDCETSPVAFLEGIYVRPDARLVGVGRALASWGRDKDKEMASDALRENCGGHIFHEAVGFEETERVVCYRRRL